MLKPPPARPPALPLVLQRRHTDEFTPPPYSGRDREVIARVRERGPDAARVLGMALGDYWAHRCGTAAGLLALNEAAGESFYRVPREAATDPAAAREALGGDQLVIDVQTHYVAQRSVQHWESLIHQMYRAVAPDWWDGQDQMVHYDLAEYLRCVFLESETAVAVLTSGPGLSPDRMLFNREMAGTRFLFERLGGGGRLLNHCVVHADVPSDLEAMEDEARRFQPVGWKCYTMGSLGSTDFGGGGWQLDDERTGVPFIRRALELGVPLICAHKGISQLAETASPRDVGPAARAFPQARLVIYHSGYEFPVGDAPPEGPYTEETSGDGVNRLVKTLRDSRIPPGSNVYAELGSTWFALIRRPEEAAHVLGKLLLAVGEDNLIWGTDGIWYGPTQVAIDALRAFQIPASYRERWGYPELTPRIKAKILGLNAARVYGIDPEQALRRARSDDLAWIRAAVEEYRAKGTPQA
jgi:predicted TIM-barrel fold metal-dependent hydrolase